MGDDDVGDGEGALVGFLSRFGIFPRALGVLHVAGRLFRWLVAVRVCAVVVGCVS